MDSDRVRPQVDHDTFDLVPAFPSSPQYPDSLDDIFDTFIHYPPQETSLPMPSPNCPRCGRTSLGSTRQSTLCNDCQSVSMLGENMGQTRSGDDLSQSTADLWPDYTITAPETGRPEIAITASLTSPPSLFQFDIGSEYHWAILPARYEPDTQEEPVQQPQQLGGRQLVLDWNMNEVRQPSRRSYTAEKRAEVRQKRGLFCEKCRKNKRRVCGYMLMLTVSRC